MNIVGTQASDVLTGTSGDDTITGLGGFDSISGGAGDDVIDGGADGDSINGGAGSDTVDGGDGNDFISDYDGGSDTLRGGAGNDSIEFSHGGSGDLLETIRIEGGLGDDRVRYYSFARGTGAIDLGDGADELRLDSTFNSAVTATLGAGRDTVRLERYATFGTAPVLTDFATGASGDVLDIGDYLNQQLVSYDGSNPFGSGGYLRLVQSGANTLLQIDRDGAAGSANVFATLLTLNNATATQFISENFNGYSPDGGPLQGRTITGTAGADSLIGTVGGDTITGLGGFDSISGGAGDDVIDGGADGDSINGGAGSDTVDGGDGNDFISDYDGGSDTLRGGAGNDTIEFSHGGSGTRIEAIRIEGGLGDDRVRYYSFARGTGAIDLGEGADELTLAPVVNGTLSVTLGAGRDTVRFERFASFGTAPVFTDFATGASGDVLDIGDYLAAQLTNWDGSSNPFGAGGHLRLTQSGANTLLQIDRDGATGSANAFATLVTFNNATATQFSLENLGGYAPDGSPVQGRTITGTAASETLTGTVGADVITGLGGADTISGGAGDDLIDGGADNDSLDGGGGNDAIEGGDGNDLIYERSGGSDTLRGGAGNDTIDVSHAGPDNRVETIRIEAGSGDDRVFYYNSAQGTAAIDLGDGADELRFEFRTDSAVTATLGAGRDTVRFGNFGSSFGIAPAITDFATGADGDMVNLGAQLAQQLINWDGSNPFGSGGYLRLVQSGANTLLQLDRDGAASTADTFFTVATFNDAVASRFTAENFSGFAPTAVNGADLATAFITAANVVGEETGDVTIDLTFKNVLQLNTTIEFMALAGLSTTVNGVDASVPTYQATYNLTQPFAADYTIQLPTIPVFNDIVDEADETIAVRVRASGQVFDTGTNETVIFIKVRDNDTTGSVGADLLAGTPGDDTLSGLGGADDLQGGAGDDLLIGGLGDDLLNGGEGLDTAVFAGVRSGYAVAQLGDGRVRVSGPDGTDLASGVERFRFDDGAYRPADKLFSASPVLGLQSFGASDAAGGWTSADRYPRTAADINGDGRADIIGFGAAGVYASLAQAGGGFGEVYLAQASFGAAAEGGGWASDSAYPRMLADVNGDGTNDLVGFGAAGVYVSLATGEGRFGAVELALRSFGSSEAAGGWTDARVYPRAAADIDGDGRADLIGFGAAGVYASLSQADGSFGDVYLAQNSFGASVAGGGWTNADAYPRQLADVNGDGMADLVGFGAAGVYVSLATGEGRFGAVELALGGFGSSDAAGGWSSDDRFPRMLADVNGDGLADIVGFGAAGASVSLGRDDGSFAPSTLELASFGTSDVAGGWASDDRFPRILADVNGDGLTDIVGFGDAGVFFAYATDLVPA